jgi:hypothetical protein
LNLPALETAFFLYKSGVTAFSLFALPERFYSLNQEEKKSGIKNQIKRSEERIPYFRSGPATTKEANELARMGEPKEPSALGNHAIPIKHPKTNFSVLQGYLQFNKTSCFL